MNHFFLALINQSTKAERVSASSLLENDDTDNLYQVVFVNKHTNQIIDGGYTMCESLEDAFQLSPSSLLSPLSHSQQEKTLRRFIFLMGKVGIPWTLRSIKLVVLEESEETDTKQ